MAKNSTGKVTTAKVKRSIGKTLLMYLLPIIVIGIAGIIVFISYNARSIITEVSLLDLQAEGRDNALDLGSEFQMLTAKNGQYINFCVSQCSFQRAYY